MNHDFDSTDNLTSEHTTSGAPPAEDPAQQDIPSMTTKEGMAADSSDPDSGHEPPYGDAIDNGSVPPYSGNNAGSGSVPPYSSDTGNDNVPPYGNNTGNGSVPPYGNNTGNGNVPPYGNNTGNGSVPPYGNNTGNGSVPPFGNNAGSGNVPPYGYGSGNGGIPPYGNVPPNQNIPPYNNRPPYGGPKPNGLATASLILGIVSLITCCCAGIGGLIFGAIGIILALLSRGREPMSNNAKIGLGLSIAGVVMGLVVMVLSLVTYSSESFQREYRNELRKYGYENDYGGYESDDFDDLHDYLDHSF